MLEVADAYLRVDRVEDAMLVLEGVRKELDELYDQGYRNYGYWLRDAEYWAVAGDPDRAMESLLKLEKTGWVGTPRLSDGYPLLKSMEGDPDFEAFQSRTLVHLNRERVESGFPEI